MTIDAMHWVWTHSRAKGNARLVLLAVADKAPGPDATVRMGTTEFVGRLNAARSSVIKAVDAALASGELVITEPAIGSRAATYQLPQAVGYVRPAPNARGPESGPVSQSYRSENETPNAEQGSGIRTGNETARGPESGPGGSENETPMGPDSGPLYQTTPTRSGSKQAGEPAPAAGATIPDFARPLVDTISLAGYDTIRWNLTPQEWLSVHALIKSHGTERLARWAVEQCSQRRISYGRYFLSGWRDLPPAPAPAPDGVTRLPALRPAPAPMPSPQAARRQASRDFLDRLSDQLAAGEHP
ncbi:hypothetical protein J7E90_17035 [Streptomyces sp. ISL-111]|uniref:hypothetical protein n=1 Tax=Streptomyces sp. ISL-111 TaxID=2819175 RepID=UPI001BEAAF62|nr:hypothetical protein [Streptomyces sp. ISL-111]MBT2379007.1 hypothetical protein [Streptomyces sp. ISL-111]